MITGTFQLLGHTQHGGFKFGGHHDRCGHRRSSGNGGPDLALQFRKLFAVLQTCAFNFV
ncbi:MAG: hypothetical protein ACK4NN_02010 [Rheinheimera sp.]